MTGVKTQIRLCPLKASGRGQHKRRRRQPGSAEDEGESLGGRCWCFAARLMWVLLSSCAGADPQDGHVLRSDGQPPAQRRQADAVRQPTGALRRHVLVHLPQPAALPLQLPLPGSSCAGQPLNSVTHAKAMGWGLTLSPSLSDAPRGCDPTDLCQLNITKQTK